MSSAKNAADALEIDVDNEVKMLSLDAQSKARMSVNIMRNSALDVLGTDGHGRRYGRHTASAPSEPPAPDTGNLRRNWRQYVLARTYSGGAEITCRLKSDVKYAPLLEHGTDSIKPRPFTAKIINKSMPEINSLYNELG